MSVVFVISISRLVRSPHCGLSGKDRTSSTPYSGGDFSFHSEGIASCCLSLLALARSCQDLFEDIFEELKAEVDGRVYDSTTGFKR